ncbi:recombinase family protein [Zunongwangia sp. F363]|uniref:Recombinase family protein n=1 Tax=Autumnicola tepida TaxID=3075595 RepID=A0ABU3C5E2_9FLAO|nr:recombinase family protein [Zunongwangia sp. F363]MDT0641557.1 recombinase family protein [Zunongwangia sp. F363]
MKIADLYIRVSTDEQADKGYSQRDQEERLRKYCEINHIQVRKVIYEDHSAKTFNRPSWIKLLGNLRKSRGQSDLILFTKWDRFSRNAGDAYQMIATLRRLGVEPQAVEQPLDLSIPENKMMLAFYLAAPEVENDRRALNVFHGMRRAKKEGRWMATAPIGYVNRINESGRKYIAPKEGQSDIIKWAFKELAKKTFNTEQVWKMAKEKGLKCSKNNFWRAIRNPVYCGKISIPKYKDEEIQLVTGQHEPLISEALFYEVQDVLDGRKKVMRTKMTVDENYPLRGFLKCPKCDRMLTGSKSKGRSKHYYYYHCSGGCKFRLKAPDMNDKIIAEIRRYVRPLPKLKLYKEIITSVYKAKTKDRTGTIQQLKVHLQEENNKLSKARELLLCGEIEAVDYRMMKADAEKTINRIEAKLTSTITDTHNIEPLWDKAISNLSQLDSLYESGSTIQKRKIIGSIFPEKLTFDGFKYRTIRVNEAIQYIMLIDRDLNENKNGTNSSFLNLSHKVTPEGFKPPTLRAEI